MKQLLQDLNKGCSIIKSAPTPIPSDNSLLIATTMSLISSGTEKMLVDFGRASYFEKIRQQPEKVQLVLEKIKTDGLIPTLEAVKSKLNQPLPLGYCHVGVVNKVGKAIEGFQPGDRIISNGPHADMVNIAKNLCATIPDNVDDETAAFTVLASIGLQGIRLAAPSLGESFAVIGVGLIGLLTVQLLKAHGCRVIAIDFDPHKLSLAQQFGAEVCDLSLAQDPVALGMAFSNGFGVDGVIITAATQSNDPVSQAARMSRKRGRIILIGVTGLELNRSEFYEKELSFQVSCSYGPGRYDPVYEKQGLDYPIGFVRWTEQRNFQAVLQLMATGQLNVKPLISHRYLFEDAPEAYETLIHDKSALGIILQYSSPVPERILSNIPLNTKAHFNQHKPIIGVIGAGNYAARILIPAFKAAGAQCHTIVSSGGLSASIQGDKLNFVTASSDIDSVLANDSINTVVIITRHDTHASLVIKALKAGKHVFVEKPLAINDSELNDIEAAYRALNPNKKVHLMLGFNRRFAPHIQKIQALLKQVNEPKTFVFTINAGNIPSDHWTQDNDVGGGRIIGEACHFIDLMRFLAGSDITDIQCKKMGANSSMTITEDKAVITLGFADGSFGTIHYLANGASTFPKERIEIFAAGRVLQLDNFRKLKAYGWPGFKIMNLWKQNKGQNECCNAFLKAIELGLETPIPFVQTMEVARVTIQVAQQLHSQ